MRCAVYSAVEHTSMNVCVVQWHAAVRAAQRHCLLWPMKLRTCFCMLKSNVSCWFSDELN